MKRRTAEEQKLADYRLLRAWERWHRERLQQALEGIHRDVLERLQAELKNLRSARELVDHIASQDWSIVDADTRLVALHEINTAITRLRERMGQEPIDDALIELGQPLRAFQLIRNIVNQFPASAGRPRPGSGVTRVIAEESKYHD